MLTRRRFLGTMAGAAGLAGAAEVKPNVIVLFADDLGYGDLGCYGSNTIRTPRIDRMAREGLRFTNFYAGAPFCSPSRAALLTGRYPVRAGVPNVLFPTETVGLPPSEVTIAKLLKGAGYATACIGKWHLGVPEEFGPRSHGFDSFYGLPYSNDMYKLPAGETFRAQHAHVELPLLDNERVAEAPVEQRTLTQRYTERALAFIKENRARPFFLYLAHTFPHSPQYASERFEGRSPHGFYADTVEELDWSTGRILGGLKEMGLERNTLVVFTSDNGPAPGRKGDPRYQGGSAGPLRGGKGTTWEGGMRVPAIFRQPGRIAAGVTTNTVGSVLDLLPTMAEMAGVPVPRDRVIDGRSLVPALGGKRMDERLFCYYFGGQLQAVRKGKWKLVLRIDKLPDKKPSSLWYELMPQLVARHYRLQPEPQLFDLDGDIGEAQNVAPRYPEVVRELEAAARAFDAGMS